MSHRPIFSPLSPRSLTISVFLHHISPTRSSSFRLNGLYLPFQLSLTLNSCSQSSRASPLVPWLLFCCRYT